jgi:hypothetical protein
MRYRNRLWKFEMELPMGWSEPGLIKRLTAPGRYAQQASNPEFYGPSGASLKFAIGPINPSPSATEQQANLAAIARRYGQAVLALETIEINGVPHATILCQVPGLGTIKNYSLIFKGTEYFVTGQGNILELDTIMGSFRLI